LRGFEPPLSREGDMIRGQALPASPKFQVDPFWPKPLPDDWVTGNVGGTCVDSNDHVFIVNRTADPTNLTNQEKEVGKPAPSVIEFDAEGNVVNSWDDPKVVPSGIHDCYFDYEGNMWIGGNTDAIAQKYSRDGKILLQIGTKGKFDTSDGTARGDALNSSHTLLNKPASFAVDPANGEVYIADGYGNRRIVVFDRSGNYLRQFGRRPPRQKATPAWAVYSWGLCTAWFFPTTDSSMWRTVMASASKFSISAATLRRIFLLKDEERIFRAMGHLGGSSCHETNPSNISTSPTVWMRLSGPSIGRVARRCRVLADSVTWRASSHSSIL
jgi:NHL repeat